MKKYSLSIENPCDKQWNQMLVHTDKIKHCTHCSKTVTDLTHLNDTELYHFIENTDDDVCVRLSNRQTNRPVFHERFHTFKSYIPGLLTGLLLFGQVPMLSSSESNIQLQFDQNSELRTMVTPKKENSITNNILSGTIIIDYDSTPAPNTKIKIKHTDIEVQSDENGFFQLEVPSHLIGKKFIISLDALFCIEKEVIIKPSLLEKNKSIQIIMEMVAVGKVIKTNMNTSK